LALAAEHSLLISVEENALIGGRRFRGRARSRRHRKPGRLLRLGIPDRFIEHGDQALLLAEIGLDRDGIVRAVRQSQDSAADSCDTSGSAAQNNHQEQQ
jgi:1-deoxy-D-xylulose-5-phosphate synthase